MNFVDSLIGFESGGRNVTNTNQTTSSGRARGFFQITDQTWQDFGRRVGIDLAKYPTALSAPREIQAQVAGAIPLKRWDPITLRRMSAAGFTFDPEKTLGENAAAHGEHLYGPTPTGAVAVTGAGQSTGNSAGNPFQGANAGGIIGSPFKGATAGASLASEGPDTSAIDKSLASAFGDLGKVNFGGGGGGGGGANYAPGQDYGLSPGDAGQTLDPLQGPQLSKLAGLFTLPTIGQPGIKAVNIGSKSWT